MSKVKSVFVCQNCGYESPKWLGKCPSCGQWNTFVEAEKITGKKSSYSSSAKPVTLKEIRNLSFKREKTGIGELDRVLGGGLVPGEVVLLAGEPGIGKSTLLLQVASKVGEKLARPVFYVAGEESPAQIKMRAERLGVKSDRLFLLPETDIDRVIAFLNEEKKEPPALLVVDSIQTMVTSDLAGAAGSVGQVREAAARLIGWAKRQGVSAFFVGHITKEGLVAGPKILEHAVDTVLYFEGDRYGQWRLLRGEKNRFGRTGEVGIFKMEANGLKEVVNAGNLFLESGEQGTIGAVRTIILEGTRPLVLEIQAIVTRANSFSPRRLARGLTRNRVELYVAILQKYFSLPLYREDVIVNVSGGVRVDEPAVDLAACLAIWSSYRGRKPLSGLIAFGEVGLLGKIGTVRDQEKRIEEAKRLGYQKIVSPLTAASLQEAVRKSFSSGGK